MSKTSILMGKKADAIKKFFDFSRALASDQNISGAFALAPAGQNAAAHQIFQTIQLFERPHAAALNSIRIIRRQQKESADALSKISEIRISPRKTARGSPFV